MNGWYGFDLDGTLAHYDGWHGPTHVGAPVLRMVDRLKAMLAEGKTCRIFTARVFPIMLIMPDDTLHFEGSSTRQGDAESSAHAIRAWCMEHLGRVLPITCVKDYGMIELYDDRAKQVIPNTGVLVEEMVKETA